MTLSKDDLPDEVLAVGPAEGLGLLVMNAIESYAEIMELDRERLEVVLTVAVDGGDEAIVGSTANMDAADTAVSIFRSLQSMLAYQGVDLHIGGTDEIRDAFAREPMPTRPMQRRPPTRHRRRRAR